MFCENLNQNYNILMKLILHCKNCSKELKVKPTVCDRVELEKILGKVFNKECPNCNTISEYHINKVYARSSISQIIILISTIILIFLLISYFYINKYFNIELILYNAFIIPFSIIIPSALYFTMHKNNKKNISLFNRYRVS